MCKEGTLLLCCTFTGLVYGISRTELVNQKVNPNYVIISKDAANKIETLKAECDLLETKLAEERERYQEMTTTTSNSKSFLASNQVPVGLSALPYFTVNDSFILQEGSQAFLKNELLIILFNV